MTEEVLILGMPIHSLTMAEAVQSALGFLREPGAHIIMTPNAEILYRAARNPRLNQWLNQADLRIADGSGLIWAARFYGKPLPERVAGIDLMSNLLSEAEKQGIRVFFLGAREEVVAAAKENAEKKWPELRICGVHHGFFTDETEEDLIQTIRNCSPEIIFVGLGAPKQEEWMCKYRDILSVPLMMGVGGSFDVLSGSLKRAPLWMQRIGIEWLYRLIKEPKRFRRILALPLFIGAVLKDKFVNGRQSQ